MLMTRSGRLFVASLDETHPVRVTELQRSLPDTSGVIVERPPTADTTDPATALGRRTTVVTETGASSRLDFLEIQPGELTRVAVTMTRLTTVVAVTICPLGVSPGRTALAHTVGAILRARRGPGHPVVMCAVCPPGLGQGRTAIPHEVAVFGEEGEIQHRIAWEVVPWPLMPQWLAYLTPTEPAAA